MSVFKYDAFILYSRQDKDWVRHILLPKLEKQGIKTFIDFRDFRIGSSTINEIERGIINSRKIILVLTPSFIKSGWTEFESLMIQTLSPSNRSSNLLPVLKEECELPIAIGYLNYINLATPTDEDLQWKRLTEAIITPKVSLPEIVGNKKGVFHLS